MLCVRKKAESEEERFAYLIKTLPNSHKRIVMDVYNSEKKPTESMFKEAVELLKEKVAKRGQREEVDLEFLQRNIKGELKSLKIEIFKYDLEKFYARFDKTVRHGGQDEG